MIRQLLSVLILALFSRGRAGKARGASAPDRDEERFAVAQLNWQIEQASRHGPGGDV